MDKDEEKEKGVEDTSLTYDEVVELYRAYANAHSLLMRASASNYKTMVNLLNTDPDKYKELAPMKETLFSSVVESANIVQSTISEVRKAAEHRIAENNNEKE